MNSVTSSGGSYCSSSNNSTQGDINVGRLGNNEQLLESIDINQNKMIDGEIYS